MKRSKLLLIGYVIIAMVLVPYALQSTQKMTTSEEAFLPGEIESIMANDIIEKEFGGDTANNIIIVVHSENGESLLNYNTLRLVMDVRDYVMNDWSVDGVKIAENFTDFFQASQGLFNATIFTYFGNIMYANLTRSIVWGLPAAFGGYWLLNYSYTGNVSLADNYASQMMNLTAEAMISNMKSALNGSMDLESLEAFETFIVNYVNFFIFAWDYVRNDETLNPMLPPTGSMEIAVTQIVRYIIDMMVSSLQDPSFATLLNSTAYILNYTTWTQFNYFYQVILDYFDKGLGANVSSSFEQKFILDTLTGALLTNDTLYMEYYFKILVNEEYPQLFPASVYSFMRSEFVSKSGDTMLILVFLKKEVENWDDSKVAPYIENLRNYLDDLSNDSIKFYVTGALAFEIDNTVNAEEDVRRIDMITFLLALILLLLIYRGVPVSVFPLLLMGLTVIIARALLLFLSMAVGLYISDITISLMTTVIIGAGVDYTVFLISRYAEDRRRGKDKDEAIISVVKHAGKSVLLSGGTVMIAFGSLMLSSFKFLQHVGMGIMLGVGITLFVALTLTPSILTVFGDKIFWPSKINSNKDSNNGRGLYIEGRYEKALRKLARWTTDHGLVVILLALIVTIPAIYAYYSFGTTYDFMKLAREGTPSKTGFEVLQNEIGSEAYSAPEVVAIFKDVNFTTSDGGINITLVNLYIKPVSDVLENISGVKCVRSAYKPYGTPISEIEDGASALEKIITIQTAVSQYISSNGTIARFVVCIKPAPYSEDAFKIIDEMRKALKNLKGELDVDVDFLVGGISANYRDISLIVDEDFRVLIVTVIIGIIILLFVALRSLLIPLRLELTILLSIIWAVTLSMVFWHFYASLQLIWFIPLFMFTVLNGLGMDYDIFLVTRIEEEKFEKRLSDKEAIIEAIASTGKIISIAGIIMAAAFGSLMLTLSPPTKQIGLTLMLGVLIDAFIVRVVLVPAIMVVAGKRNWWPRKVEEK